MKYNAFISYRHSELDMYMAKKVHKSLETYKAPAAVAKKYGARRIERVFRDQEELPIGSDLGENIGEAMKESEYLIVICSPRTPESWWVRQEISTFIKLHDRHHVLAVLIEGEPDESFPKELLVDDEGRNVEPLAADVRGVSKAEMSKKFKTEMIRLAAPLLHCNYDDLKQRHRERRMKKIIASVAAGGIAMTAFGVGFGLYQSAMASKIEENYRAKQVNQSKYLADTSLNLLKNCDRRTATLLALEALPIGASNDKPFVAKAQYALNEALYPYAINNDYQMDRVLKNDLPTRTMKMDSTGQYLTVIDSSDCVYVWDMKTGTRALKINPEIKEDAYVNSVEYANVMGGNLALATKTNLKVYNLEGKEIWNIDFATLNTYFSDIPSLNLMIAENKDSITYYDIGECKTIESINNEQEENFTSEIVSSLEGNITVIPHYIDTMPKDLASTGDAIASSGDASLQGGTAFATGKVTVYDLENKKQSLIEPKTDYILEAVAEKEGSIYLATVDNYVLTHGSNYSSVKSYIQKFTPPYQRAVWTYEYDFTNDDIMFSKTILKKRDYKDQDGTEHHELIYSCGTRIRVFDSETGELVNDFGVSGRVKDFMVDANSPMGYMIEDNGTFERANLTTGNIYSNANISINANSTQMAMAGNLLCLRVNFSPDIYVLSTHAGEGMEQLETQSSSITNTYLSKDESFYCVETESGTEGGVYTFYGTSSNQKLYEYNVPENGLKKTAKFIDDSRFYLVFNNKAVLIDLKKKTEEETKGLEKDAFISHADFSANKKHVVLYNTSEYYLINMDKNEASKVTMPFTDSLIISLKISNDGKTLFAIDANGTKEMDAKTGETTFTYPEEYQIVHGLKPEYNICLGQSERYVAVACRDDKLRIFDRDEKKTVNEFTFLCRNYMYIQFSDDESKMYLQGDDYYFRVYNRKTKEFDYIANEQDNTIDRVEESADGNSFTMHNSVGLVVYSKEQCAPIARVEGGQAFFSKTHKVFVSDRANLYSFPYADLTKLIQEANRQFPDEKLTEEEKIKYHVE